MSGTTERVDALAWAPAINAESPQRCRCDTPIEYSEPEPDGRDTFSCLKCGRLMPTAEVPAPVDCLDPELVERMHTDRELALAARAKPARRRRRRRRRR